MNSVPEQAITRMSLLSSHPVMVDARNNRPSQQTADTFRNAAVSRLPVSGSMMRITQNLASAIQHEPQSGRSSTTDTKPTKDLNHDGVVDNRDKTVFMKIYQSHKDPAQGLVGDFDNNGHVSFSDLAVLKKEFGTAGASGTDLDGDGKVGQSDLEVFKKLFGLSDQSALVDYNDDGRLTHADVRDMNRAIDESAVKTAQTDLNGDGRVDRLDVNVFRKIFQSHHNPGRGLVGDFDGNGSVSFGDLAILKREFGTAGKSGTDLDGSGKVDEHDLEVFRKLFNQPDQSSIVDFNNDGVLSFRDLRILRQAVNNSAQQGIRGDFNHDGKVSFADLAILKAEFHTTGKSGTDLNHDGVVNEADYIEFRKIFQNQTKT